MNMDVVGVQEVSPGYEFVAENSAVPVGYKQTEVGVIPIDWDAVLLGETGEALIGLTYKPSDVKEHGTLVLRSSNIQNSKLTFNDSVFVDADIPERIKVRLGDVLICARNGSRDLIGKSAFLDERVEGMTFGAFMAVYRSKIGRLASFLFQSEILKRQINEHLGATINQITNKSLNSFRIPLPPTETEQRAIATALSDVDALLEELDRLIAKKRDIKQAAMQQLLTGETRLPGFEGEWEAIPLGSLGRFLKGSGVKRDDAMSGNIPCVRYGEIYTLHNDVIREFNSWISEEVAQSAVLIQKGDVLFAGSGETKEEIGKCVALVDEVAAYAGGDIVILRTNNAHPAFLGYALNQPSVIRQKSRFGQGDAVVHISAASLAKVIVKVPRFEEQAAIASVISDIDTEIQTLEQRRSKTAELKQGMMQELLTGRTRLV